MQVVEMRTLYNLYHHKKTLHLIKTNFFSNPKIPTQIGCFPPKYHSLARRRIHSSNPLSSNVEDENPRVWTTFDPVLNDVTTRAVAQGEGLRCESDSGDEKVATLSGLGSFVEGIEGSGVTPQSWSSVYAGGEGNSSVEGLVPERDGGGDAKEADEESCEPVPKSWASVYPKRNGVAWRRVESKKSAVGGSRSLRSEIDSGDDKFEALAGLGSYQESSVQERGSDVDEKFEEDTSGVTPKSWSTVYRKESGGTSSGAVATARTVDGNTSLSYASDIGNDMLGILSEGLVPDSGAGAGKKTSDEALSGGRGGDKASQKSWSSVKRHRGATSVKDKSVDHLSTGVVASKKKKGKTKTSWVCSSCGETFGQWWGSCRFCGGELKQFFEAEDADSKTTGFNITDKVVGSWFLQKPGELIPQRLSDVNKGINQLTWRIPLSGLFGAEVGRVLGGGLVPGSLVLVGGDPGVGKSTLLLQIAAMIAEGHGSGQPAPVVYVSGEESVEQIANRADRMRVGTDDLFLYSGTDIEDILEKIHVLSPRALIVDSIQTVYLKGVAGSAGGIVQVKECTQSLLRFAKKTNIPVLLIGHVTKTGDLAGPRVLEHIVDVVLYMEGEKYSTHRFLRSVKNRFGSTDELGVFEMSQAGLQAVLNPSDIFLSEQHSDSEILVGLAIAVIIDGSRSFLLEVQALCLADASVPRQFNGVQQSRAQMIISVLIKQAGLMLQNNAIFVNVVSGVKLQETAGDLAIAAAICSSFLEFPIPNDIAFIGEIGLGGELRPVPRMEKRVNAVAKLGYRKCIVPKSTEKQLTTLDSNGMMILGCKNLKEVINIVFRN